MQIDFSKIPELDLSTAGAEVHGKMFKDGQNSASILRLSPKNSFENVQDNEVSFVYVISGFGKVVCNSVEEELKPGILHYRKQGEKTSIQNSGETDLILLAITNTISEPKAKITSAAQDAPKSDKVIVYTDGGCHGNPGPGGWGTVILADGEVRELSGGEKQTTNNRMELTAAISALTAIFNTERLKSRQIEVFIDSQYVKNGITSWIKGWKKNGWLTTAKKPVLNRELWESLDFVVSRLNVKWNWVKGHAGIEYNEICDQLCQKEIAKFE
ncbi:ribonuclease HI [Treponema zioleckii]|uniref:ribonuclease HI n=1 Tax=Treponema zioleckii TaxID=331680 RepID=UPI0030EF665B